MKNRMCDVRDHLVAMLERLNDAEVAPEVIERAKAASMVATTYISAVKCEIDALRLLEDTGKLPDAIAAPYPTVVPPPLRAMGSR